MIAFSRPFWPLFLHVLGAMTLFGAVLTAAIAAYVAWRRPEGALLGRVAFRALVFVGVPAYVVMRVGAQWIADKEGFGGDSDPTWVTIGMSVADAGLLLLLAAIGVSFWWQRSRKPVAGRIVAVLSSLYLLALAVAWLAMSGKWG